MLMLSFSSPGLLLLPDAAAAPALSSLSARAGGVWPLTGLPPLGAEYGVLPVYGWVKEEKGSRNCEHACRISVR